MEVDKGEVRRLTPPGGLCESPSWSPDGKEVAYVDDRDGFREIYIIGADGRNARRLTRLHGAIHSPAWSPVLHPGD
jgi:TolB protein